MSDSLGRSVAAIPPRDFRTDMRVNERPRDCDADPMIRPGTPSISATLLPRVCSSAPAFSSMMVKTNSTMMAPA